MPTPDEPLTLDEIERIVQEMDRRCGAVIDHFLAHPADLDEVRSLVHQGGASLEAKRPPLARTPSPPPVLASQFLPLGLAVAVDRHNNLLQIIRLPHYQPLPALDDPSPPTPG